jgi:hypothetical protein
MSIGPASMSVAPRASMSDQPPKGGAPPHCNRCQVPMRSVIAIPLVDEPRRAQIFECSACGKLEFRPEGEQHVQQ